MKKVHRFIATCSLLLLTSGAALAAATPVEKFGEALFFDKRLSSPMGQSCASCHGAKVGFTGPMSMINRTGAVYPGAVRERFGNRKPPAAAYGGNSPLFHLDEAGFFVGGMFWDGRATGEVTGDPLADQAMGPFLNPVEQNNPSELAVCEKVAAGPYAFLYPAAFGAPLDCSQVEDGHLVAYKNFARAIAAFERSEAVSPYTSKYDAVKAGKAFFTPQEARGEALFNGKAKCFLCHSGKDFTDFTYDNIGSPKNPQNPFYRMDTVYLDSGDPINPEGEEWIDYGLGAILETRSDYAALADANMGKHKVPTLRNVDLRPGRMFVKAFGHNGYFKSLEGIVHFYNTRDVKPVCGAPLTMDEALVQGCWPAPEVAENVNKTDLGDLKLTAGEEAAVVAFLRTLSDGFGSGMRKGGMM